MLSTRNRFLILILATILVSLTLPRPSSAQCWYLGSQFQNISLETANAFVADYSTNTSSPLAASAAAFSHSGLRAVARDSEGRVRVVRAAGKYIVKDTDGVSTEIERLNITICDPTGRTTIILDTASKTATVNTQSGKFPRIIKPVHGQGESFCANVFSQRGRIPQFRTEDLGHQTISGYDAAGIRIRYIPLSVAPSDVPPSNYSELWCSDALGAVVQQTSESKLRSGREFKSESSMQNIERREPEPSLFQIPADYTILERDTSADRRPLAPPIPAPPDSKP